MDLRAPCTAEEAILAALAGTAIADVAARVRSSPEHLAESIELYRAAGRAALDSQPAGWHQVSIEFANYPDAEYAFITHLLPPLRTVAETGAIAAWWFVRKYPCWRLRATPGPNTTTEEAIGPLTC